MVLTVAKHIFRKTVFKRETLRDAKQTQELVVYTHNGLTN